MQCEAAVVSYAYAPTERHIHYEKFSPICFPFILVLSSLNPLVLVLNFFSDLFSNSFNSYTVVFSFVCRPPFCTFISINQALLHHLTNSHCLHLNRSTPLGKPLSPSITSASTILLNPHWKYPRVLRYADALIGPASVESFSLLTPPFFSILPFLSFSFLPQAILPLLKRFTTNYSLLTKTASVGSASPQNPLARLLPLFSYLYFQQPLPSPPRRASPPSLRIA